LAYFVIVVALYVELVKKMPTSSYPQPGTLTEENSRRYWILRGVVNGILFLWIDRREWASGLRPRYPIPIGLIEGAELSLTDRHGDRLPPIPVIGL
jgi:hypothetical protein